ncbi:MAG: DUF2497 domain-containing protein [Cucumibacter sp.]
MDEILSSIRQIIADDDAASAERAQAAPPRPAPSTITASARPAAPKPAPVAEPKLKPAAFSETRIVDEADFSVEADLDDIVASAETVHAPRLAPRQLIPNDVRLDKSADEADPEPEEKPTKPQPSPSLLPDPSLSADLADQLLAPAADAATRHAFTQLNVVALAGKQRTIEDLIREMLRPMLKGWLDENLPSMVERMVQREIERVSRSGK